MGAQAHQAVLHVVVLDGEIHPDGAEASVVLVERQQTDPMVVQGHDRVVALLSVGQSGTARFSSLDEVVKVGGEGRGVAYRRGLGGRQVEV